MTWRRRGVKGSPSGYLNRSPSFEEDRVRRSPADARNMIGGSCHARTTAGWPVGAGQHPHRCPKGGKGPGTFSAASPAGMTGSLSGATFPPDGGSFIQILRSSLATGAGSGHRGASPENKSILIKSSIISSAHRAPTATQSRARVAINKN